MKLSDRSLQDRALWEKTGVELPRFDRASVIAKTRAAPQWLHFGTGNIFRAFLADLSQRLLDSGDADTGIIAAAPYDTETIDAVYRPYDNLGILAVLKTGKPFWRVLASVTETLAADPSGEDWRRLTEVFCAPSLQMVSFTVTEKGYATNDTHGGLLPAVEADCQEGPGAPATLLGKLAALCYARYCSVGAGEPPPLALVSMDNCSQNGDRLRDGVLLVSRAWEKHGFVPPEFSAWLEDPRRVSFPWTMIDKITPRPDETIRAALEAAGLEGMNITRTKKNTWIAPFVNAEEWGCLVIEDAFPNGRPPLEKAGALFADRETVDRVERMKVGACLNPLHTALAVYGCLLGYTSIHEEMNDPALHALVTRLGYDECLPAVVSPGIIDPGEFLRQVLEERFPNPFIPDTPQRIACDTSQKLPVRLGGALKSWLRRRPGAEMEPLVAIPLVYAGWCRYLMGIDDQGNPFEPSPDPLLPRLRAVVEGIGLGGAPSAAEAVERLRPILSDSALFGVNLYEAGLAERVAAYFTELRAGPGAVRNTLRKYVKGE
ncbi:MAG: mannitol dehydrogenase family protein [Treponema sp.]|jgi:fructuronate reductase|nr:mannitol dehydrogenase family protein [Treponema sp.]